MNKPPSMLSSYSEFTGSIPENYERHFVPLIFADYAELLANALDTSTKLDILELACGTGIVTRNILKNLQPGSNLLATDINDAHDCPCEKSNWQRASSQFQAS